MAGYVLGRDVAAAQAVAKLMIETGMDSMLRMAELQAYCRNIDKSFARLSQMRSALLVRADENELFNWIDNIHLSPFLATVRNDPRWESWLKQTRDLVLAAN